MTDQPIRHIVFFKLYDGVDDAQKQEALKALRDLGQDEPGISEWTVEKSLDTRKGAIIVENGLFVNAEALEKFRTSSKHQKVAELMTQIADWLVGDYTHH